MTGDEPKAKAEAPRADGCILDLGFESEPPDAVRELGRVLIVPGSMARITTSFSFSGRGCAVVECPEPGQEGLIRLAPETGAPLAGDGTVLEFVYRPVIDRAVELTGFPILRCLGRDERGESGWPVMVELRARGSAAEGTYDVEVTSGKAIVAAGGAGLSQTNWYRFVLHRVDGQVALWLGPPGEEQAIAAYPDLDPDLAVHELLLGNGGNPWALGSGYWDEVRLGQVIPI
ncbi:MAG: hypothetical protein WDA75_21700 [Candidatus Latescibacterota bacterium]|jgi:hypothetical protein